jgi:hypothetical protein
MNAARFLRLPIFGISGETCPSLRNTPRELKVGSGTVQRIKRAMADR